MKRSKTGSIKLDNLKKYEFEFLFILFKDELTCLVCKQVIKGARSFNLERHYTQAHKSEYELIKDENRNKKINELKNNFLLEENKYSFVLNEKPMVTKANYIASYRILKDNKPFVDGEFLKSVFLDILEAFGEKGKV